MKLLRRVRAAVVLAAIFVWDLVTASIGVARIVLAPQVDPSPAILVVPVALQRPWAVALFASFTSLTPGSTCLHVSQDRKRLYVHVLDTVDEAASIARLKRFYERWIAELGG